MKGNELRAAALCERRTEATGSPVPLGHVNTTHRVVRHCETGEILSDQWMCAWCGRPGPPAGPSQLLGTPAP